MATEPSPLPPIADLMKVFEIEETARQITRAQAEAIPVLTRELKSVTERAKAVYGDGWLDLVTLAPRPAPRDAAHTKHRPDFADVMWAAKRERSRPYRVFTGQGKRAVILGVRAGMNVNAGGLGGRLIVWGRAEVRLLEEVWHACRDECTALMEAGAPLVWADVGLPGPPHTTIADHMDRLLGSHADWLVIASEGATSDRTPESAFASARWGFVCVLPILVGVIEAALDRQPSVRTMHQRLCKYLLERGETEEGRERGHISSALRYKVFEKDGFKCVMCGATAATGAALEADHIVPRAKGGKNVLENLQTLCDRCNRGKSANLSPDLRLRR